MRRPTRRGVVLCGSAATALAARGPARSQGPDSGSDAEVAGLLARAIDDQRRGTGAAAAIVRPGSVVVLAHGVTRLGGDRRPDGSTVFQIASLTKVFTALLLVDAARRGEVWLDDPLGKHLPVPAPTFQGRPITLRDLATHSAGLPLRPASRLDRGQEDPYAGYTHADLLSDLAKVRLERAPGTAFQYSNFGYGLLGAALSHRTGRTFEELLQGRILGPLGMDETRLVPGPAMAGRLIQGYEPDFRPVRPSSDGALAPAGGLFSTLDDMARFLRVFTLPDAGPLRQAASLMRVVERPGDDPETRMVLGWRETGRGRKALLWSNGNGGGVRSFMGVRPSTGTGVIAFVNRRSGGGVDDIGLHVLDPSRPVDVSVAPARTVVQPPVEALERLVGVYEYAPGDRMAIERDGEGLVLVQGGQRIRLFAETPTQWFVKEVEATFDFEAAESGPAAAFVLSQGGRTYRYVRTRPSP